MKDPSPSSNSYHAFTSLFNTIAKHKHRYQVFSDFVALSAYSLHNATHYREDLEQEYLRIIGTYDKGDQQNFPKLLAALVTLMETDLSDQLGPLYMQLELGEKAKGQFFTPDSVSTMMAEMLLANQENLAENGFVTLSEPACGAGGMVLAFAKAMKKHGMNPQKQLWVQCTDIDRTTALMCYIQLSLWHIPAEIIVGNTLSQQRRDVLYTPAHVLGLWHAKLKKRFGLKQTRNNQKATTSAPLVTPEQLDIFPAE